MGNCCGVEWDPSAVHESREEEEVRALREKRQLFGSLLSSIVNTSTFLGGAAFIGLGLGKSYDDSRYDSILAVAVIAICCFIVALSSATLGQLSLIHRFQLRLGAEGDKGHTHIPASGTLMGMMLVLAGASMLAGIELLLVDVFLIITYQVGEDSPSSSTTVVPLIFVILAGLIVGFISVVSVGMITVIVAVLSRTSL